MFKPFHGHRRRHGCPRCGRGRCQNSAAAIGRRATQRANAIRQPATSTPAAAPASAATAAPLQVRRHRSGRQPNLMSRMAGPLAGIAAGIGLGYLFFEDGRRRLLGLLLIVGIAIVALICLRAAQGVAQQPAAAGAGRGSNFDAAPQAQTTRAPVPAGAAAPVMAKRPVSASRPASTRPASKTTPRSSS